MTRTMLIRLQNGEDIIGIGTLIEGGIHIQEPMSVFVDYRNNQPKGVLQLTHWLPVQLIKSNDVYLKDLDILAIMDPEEQFEECYLNATAKIKSILESKADQDELDQEQIQDIFESMNLDKNQVIH